MEHKVDIMDLSVRSDDFEQGELSTSLKLEDISNIYAINDEEQYLASFVQNTNLLLKMSGEVFLNVNKHIDMADDPSDFLHHQIQLIRLLKDINSNFLEIKKMMKRQEKEREKEAGDTQNNTQNNYYNLTPEQLQDEELMKRLVELEK